MPDFTAADHGRTRPLIATECDDCRRTFPADAETNNRVEATYGRLLCADCCLHARPRRAA